MSSSVLNHAPPSRFAAVRYAFGNPSARRLLAPRNLGRGAPIVTISQWMLAVAAVGVALLGSLSQSINSAVIIVIVISVLSFSLAGIATYHALRWGLIGQAAMLGALWVMFFMEALQSALGRLPFSPPQYFHFGATQFDVEVIRLSYCIFAFFSSCLVGFAVPEERHVFGHWLVCRTDVSRGRLTLQIILVSCILLSLGSIYTWDWGHLFGSVLGSYRARLGQDRALLIDPPFLSYLLPMGLYGTAVMLVESLQSRGIRRYVLGTVATMATVLVMLTGTRHTVLVILVPFLAFIVRRSYRHLRFSAVLLGASVVLLFGLLSQLQVVTRNVGWEAVPTIDSSQLVNAEVTGQFPALLLSESLVPTQHGFFFDSTPVQFITYWIPRRFWREKPVDPVFKYYNDEVTGGDTVWNVTPSVIGQFYMNYGVIGLCAIGCFLGMACRVTDNTYANLTLHVHEAAAVCVAGLYVFVINSLRYFAPFYIVYWVMAVIGMIALTRTNKLRHLPIRVLLFSKVTR